MAEPLFSILTPVYRPPAGALKAMLESVRSQTHSDWEHCLVDDASGDPEVSGILDQAAAADPRIKVHHRSEQGGIVAATNDGLEMASGKFAAFIDHDDEIHPRALQAFADAIGEHPDADYLYSDQDKINKRGMHTEPFVKPAWSPDRLPAQMFTTHLRVMRRSLVSELGGLREGFDGSQDWDLALRIAERTDRFVRVPGILYHWRALASSAAGDVHAKPWAHEASRRAVTEHVERLGIQATVETIPGFPGHYWLRAALVDRPKVSIVIPTAGRAREGDEGKGPLVLNCVRSIVERTTYENYELVLVVDDDAPQGLVDELGELAGDRLKLVGFEGPFNFSAKVNLGAENSTGEHLLLLNDDVEVLPEGWRPVKGGGIGGLPDWDTTAETGGRRIWIESMLAYSMQAGVGAVGAKLYLPDGRLQHGGVIGRGGLVGHPYYLHPGDNLGYMGVLLVACNFLAVTGACLMSRAAPSSRSRDSTPNCPLNYNDVDYCLKLRDAGLRSVMVPQVEMLHYESVSRGLERPADAEIESLQERWGDLLAADPFYPLEFVDSDYNLPVLNRHGEFQARADVWTHLLRVQTLHREGGVRLIVDRALRKLCAVWRGSARGRCGAG